MEDKSYLYLLNLGNFSNLNSKFVVDNNEFYNENFLFLKFGRTNSIEKRIQNHKNFFHKLTNEFPEILYKVEISNCKYLTASEKTLKERLELKGYNFVKKDINGKFYNEIFLISINNIPEIIEIYNEISQNFINICFKNDIEKNKKITGKNNKLNKKNVEPKENIRGRYFLIEYNTLIDKNEYYQWIFENYFMGKYNDFIIYIFYENGKTLVFIDSGSKDIEYKYCKNIIRFTFHNPEKRIAFNPLNIYKYKYGNSLYFEEIKEFMDKDDDYYTNCKDSNLYFIDEMNSKSISLNQDDIKKLNERLDEIEINTYKNSVQLNFLISVFEKINKHIN